MTQLKLRSPNTRCITQKASTHLPEPSQQNGQTPLIQTCDLKSLQQAFCLLKAKYGQLEPSTIEALKELDSGIGEMGKFLSTLASRGASSIIAPKGRKCLWLPFHLVPVSVQSASTTRTNTQDRTQTMTVTETATPATSTGSTTTSHVMMPTTLLSTKSQARINLIAMMAKMSTARQLSSTSPKRTGTR